MLIKVPKSWELSESAATPEHVYLNRRRFLKRLGLGGLSLAAGGCFLSVDEPNGQADGGDATTWDDQHRDLYPAPRNTAYEVPGRALTPEETVLTFNNFYEFTTAKEGVHELVDRFQANPWTVEVGGLVHRPQTFDFDTLVRSMSLEERLYRLRCVEAWSATVPWAGFPLSALLALVEPMGSARFVSMVTAERPEQMPGLDSTPSWPWPYHEGLGMDEATNDLAFIVTGAYGKPLSRQNGAPMRLVVPWKYGYKSIKSIVRIDLVETQPPTFWNTLVPNEYGFASNVDPDVPHPRWSQAMEVDIGTGERIPTLPYNGYAEYVAHLY